MGFRSGRHRLVGWAAFMLSALASPEAATADDLESALGEPLVEVSHAVRARVEDGIATFRVRRAFANKGAVPDEAALRVRLPKHGAVTGLRVLSGTSWLDAELCQAPDAVARHAADGEPGTEAVDVSALLEWRTSEEVNLRVYPVPPLGVRTIEYTVRAPTTYSNGRYVFTYPRFEEGEGALTPPVMTLELPDGVSRGFVDGELVASGLAYTPRTRWKLDPVCERLAGRATSGCVSSQIWVGSGAWTTNRMAVRVTLEHESPSDLRAELIPPHGDSILVFAEGRGLSGVGRGDNGTTYEISVNDRWSNGSAEGEWSLALLDGVRGDVGVLRSWSLGLASADHADAPLVFRQGDDAALGIPDEAPNDDRNDRIYLESEAPPELTSNARLGVVSASPEQSFVRFEMDVAPRLASTPKGLSVVFVIDASRSIVAEGVHGQLEIAKAYMGHLTDAAAEVVLYRRGAERLFSRFVPSGEFSDAVSSAESERLERRNGSDLDIGLLLATKALGERRGRGDARIVVMTDGHLRSSWDHRAAQEILRAAPDGTIVHVLVANYLHANIPDERDDGHRLASLAVATGGVLWTGGGFEHCPGKEFDRKTLALVRPTSIDGLRALGGPEGLSLPVTLEEGAGVRFMASSRTAVRSLELHGKVWGRPFQRVVRADDAHLPSTAALVFSRKLFWELTPSQQARLSEQSGAVSPVTSYVLVGAEGRPARDPVEASTPWSSCSSGSLMHWSGSQFAEDEQPDVRSLLEPGVERCRGRVTGTSVSEFASLIVELSYEEVVDVTLETPPTPFGRCVEAAAWELPLEVDDPRDLASRRNVLVRVERGPDAP